MALEGKAEKFALELKGSLKQKGIDIDRPDMDRFEAEAKSRINGYNGDGAARIAKDARKRAEDNLKRIDELCKNSNSYEHRKKDYDKLLRNENGIAGFAINGGPLSDTARKLAKAIYIRAAMEEYDLNGSAVPAAVFCAANLCQEWRTAAEIAFAWMTSGQKGLSTETILKMVRGSSKNEAATLYKLVPGLQGIFPRYLEEIRRQGNIKGARKGKNGHK